MSTLQRVSKTLSRNNFLVLPVIKGLRTDENNLLPQGTQVAVLNSWLALWNGCPIHLPTPSCIRLARPPGLKVFRLWAAVWDGL